MSYVVEAICVKRVLGTPVRKQTMMYLANKASDDGSGIWCSKGTISKETELGLSTVKRAIGEFLEEGLLIECGTRKHDHGITKYYQISLSKIQELPEVWPKDEVEPTRPALDGVQGEPPASPQRDSMAVRSGLQTTLKQPLNNPLRA